MEDEYDSDHDHDDDDDIVPRRWSWMHVAAVTFNLGGNLGKAAWAYFDDLKDAAKAHVAVDDDRTAAYESLHRDLESLD